MKRYIIALITGFILFILLQYFLEIINHFDFLCFIITGVATVFIIAIVSEIAGDEEDEW